jgi:arginyl-tRNA synthetase
VTREFYINDRGNQMDLFGASASRPPRSGNQMPEDGYQGDYIKPTSRQRSSPLTQASSTLPADERLEAFREPGTPCSWAKSSRPTRPLQHPLRRVVLRANARLQDAVVAKPWNSLRDHGHLFDDDGALVDAYHRCGDDKDRVLIRSNGELTYFASDTAYYLNKRERGFDLCIYLSVPTITDTSAGSRPWPLVRATTPSADIEVLIGQLVKIFQRRRGAEALQARRHDRHARGTWSTRLASMPCATPLLAIQPTPLTLDVAEMTKQASDNPVYYVQYAHARTAA